MVGIENAVQKKFRTCVTCNNFRNYCVKIAKCMLGINLHGKQFFPLHSFDSKFSDTCFSHNFSNLRYDSIAQLLTLANVRAHANVMVCESVAGLLLGAVAERLGGQ